MTDLRCTHASRHLDFHQVCLRKLRVGMHSNPRILFTGLDLAEHRPPHTAEEACANRKLPVKPQRLANHQGPATILAFHRQAGETVLPVAPSRRVADAAVVAYTREVGVRHRHQARTFRSAYFRGRLSLTAGRIARDLPEMEDSSSRGSSGL